MKEYNEYEFEQNLIKSIDAFKYIKSSEIDNNDLKLFIYLYGKSKYFFIIGPIDLSKHRDYTIEILNKTADNKDFERYNNSYSYRCKNLNKIKLSLSDSSIEDMKSLYPKFIYKIIYE